MESRWMEVQSATHIGKEEPKRPEGGEEKECREEPYHAPFPPGERKAAEQGREALSVHRQHERLAMALEQMAICPDEQSLFTELANAIADIFLVSPVHVMRYIPHRGEVHVVASTGTSGLPGSQSIPAMHLSAHVQVIEGGRARVISRTQVEETEWHRLYPPHVERVLLLPLGKGSQFKGAVCVNVTAQGVDASDPLLRSLLQAAAVAWERVVFSRHLQVTREEMHLVLTSVQSGLLILSPTLTVIQANPAAAALWDCEVEDLIGISAKALLGRPIVTLVASATTEGIPPSVETAISTESGEKRDVRVSVVPLPGSVERERRYLVTLVDVTEQRRLARLRKQMIANITHEMRTPIAVIKGYVELLEEEARWRDPALRQEALDFIQQSADDLLQIVDMYLNLAALEAGEVSLVREQVYVEDLVRAVWGEIEARGKDLPTFRCDVAEEAQVIWADSYLLAQLVRQVLDNALKFTPPEGSVCVEARGEGSALRLRIVDTGIGIAREDLPHVFDPFYRGANARDGVPGSGLGLALVRAIVAYLGGKVLVKNGRERGTVVEILLPGVIVPGAPTTSANLRPSER